MTQIIQISDAEQALRGSGPVYRGDRLPLLYDVTLPAMSPQAFMLAGFERIDGTDYARSWLVTQAWQTDFAEADTTNPAGA